MPIHSYNDIWPSAGRGVFLAPGAHLTGDVVLGDDVSFWFHTAARGDVHRIRIGSSTNVQDGSILHVSYQTHPLEIGDRVSIGHSAMVHGCVIESGALIGIGARVLDGACIEQEAQIGAGAVVAPGHRVPARSLALGVPARVVRPLTDAELANNRAISDRYVRLKDEYSQRLGSGWNRLEAVVESGPDTRAAGGIELTGNPPAETPQAQR
ncbi:MAG: gamma carbonic anhydrase family protein [Acidobacteria bacterium]|nr:MAG: gamma carbonic anhydrase family protein [Acidobacteriota bacterium]REK04423.1 MAG: gamma carbonic anhydrase family protein [Acidobacteriota bacterium]